MLVVIASFGNRNLALLNETIACYQAMRFATQVMVVSEAPKKLASGVRVVIGLPSRDPFSLPFAHKQVFAQCIDDYDLFVYSEDDIGVTEQNIDSFLKSTSVLSASEIAGFVRYENRPRGGLWIPDAHSSFHWEPGSLITRGGREFAYYTNEHAAFYVLTRDQLKRAIASGGFHRAPYAARYDMREAAATDPYTSCGFRKVVCISEFRDSLVHHMSNRYSEHMGLPLAEFEQQLDALRDVRNQRRSVKALCPVESKITGTRWSKSYYEPANEAVLNAIPLEARRVLSVGCGWGKTEAALRRRGVEVVGFPLDSVIASNAAAEGVIPVLGTLDECFDAMRDRRFDCVLIPNLLHLQREPADLLHSAIGLLDAGGTLVIESPNFDRLRTLTERILRRGFGGEMRSFDKAGLHPLRPSHIGRLARKMGLGTVSVRWHSHSLPESLGLGPRPIPLGRVTASAWVLSAKRKTTLS